MTTSERPTFWMVAGPNGSGKSSLYGNTDIEAFDQSVWIINPDLLTQRIQDVEKLPLHEANVQAVVRIEVWLEASIRAHQTVGVETVLSTDKYRRLVLQARQRQFEFRLIFVMLASPDLNVQRVRLRVSKGGHDVPEARSGSAGRNRLDSFPGTWTRPIRRRSSTIPARDRNSLGESSEAWS